VFVDQVSIGSRSLSPIWASDCFNRERREIWSSRLVLHIYPQEKSQSTIVSARWFHNFLVLHAKIYQIWISLALVKSVVSANPNRKPKNHIACLISESSITPRTLYRKPQPINKSSMHHTQRNRIISAKDTRKPWNSWKPSHASVSLVRIVSCWPMSVASCQSYFEGKRQSLWRHLGGKLTFRSQIVNLRERNSKFSNLEPYRLSRKMESG